MSIVTENQPDGTPTWIDLGVPDLDRALDFYGALFGWQFDVGPAEYGRYTTAYVDGSRVAALAPNSDPEATRFWWNVYLATADCDATAATVEQAGGTVVDPPADVMDRGRMAIVRDPAGGQFGLWQGRRAHRLRAGQRAQHTGPQRPGHRPARGGPPLLCRGLRLHLGRQPGSARVRLHLSAPSRRTRDRRDHGRAERGRDELVDHVRGRRHRRRTGPRRRRGRDGRAGGRHDLRPVRPRSPTRSGPSSRSSPGRPESR